MDLRPLRYFIMVAETLNFTEAAKLLYVAQPAVSQQIAFLEKKLRGKTFPPNETLRSINTCWFCLFERRKKRNH